MEFDITLPLVLFFLNFIAVLTYMKIEGKLKQVFEEKEFQVRDVILLVAAMGVTVSVVIFVPSMAFMIFFLFAFSMLTFLFSFMITSKWYISIIPPVIFISFYYFGVFQNISLLWNLYVLNAFVMIFSVLIIVYLGSLFTWKATAVFAVLLTVMDIIQVLFTRHMVAVSQTAVQLQLPLLVILPTIPPVYTEQGLRLMGLGLGDLFFAGLLGLQTFKKFGKEFAVISMAGISLSFFVFETLMLTYEVGAFPGTLMILCGWLPIVLVKEIRERTVKA